jgi:CRP-like cAMP-binding protein
MKSALSARDDNQLLAALPNAEWRHLQAELEWVALPLGSLLYEAGAVLRHVYFPTSAIVSLVSCMQDGASAEVAVVGNEGVVGVCAFMGGGQAHSSAVVQSAGHAWRMNAPAIAAHAQRSPAVMQQLLAYTQALFTQMAQTSACNRHHALDQQLCRWLLLNHDRQPGNELKATQERIAGMLGVRREGVTGGALKLQRAGLIHYERGRIAILDRRGLEARSCECYSVVKRAYDHLSHQSAPQSLGVPARYAAERVCEAA